MEKPHTAKPSPENARNLDALIEWYGLGDLHPLPPPNARKRFAKRCADVALSALALVGLLLPMALVALAVVVDDPGPVFFKQRRVGRGGRSFWLYKFRTMQENTPQQPPTPERQDPRGYVTRVGRFLRRSSLDELPQLFNVLRGDMSLVGPRPLIEQEQTLHRLRSHFGVYRLRPGVTGLAQVNGRDFCAPGDKLRWDVTYLERFGLGQDVRILLSTVPKVLRAEGVQEKPGAR